MRHVSALAASYALWAVFYGGWLLSAVWTGKGAAKAPLAQRAGYYVMYFFSFGLMFTAWVGTSGRAAAGVGFASLLPVRLGSPLWGTPALLAALLLVLEAAGFGLAIWARVHLGRLWSGMMTLRPDHRVVDTGPYCRVRHPIYTGFLAAGLGLALLEATPAALAGWALLAATFAVKARHEERFLRAELGADAYDRYAARTPMLLPWPVRARSAAG